VRTSVLPWRRKVGGNRGSSPSLTSRRSRACNAAALPPDALLLDDYLKGTGTTVVTLALMSDTVGESHTATRIEAVRDLGTRL